jgi:transposase
VVKLLRRCSNRELLKPLVSITGRISSKPAPRTTGTRHLDPFHVVALATKALDQVRRDLVGQLRRSGHAEQAATIKNTRWALLKNPDSLNTDQRTMLAGIQATSGRLYRTYLLEEQLRASFQARDLTAAKRLQTDWPAWAQRSRLPAFVKLTKTITNYRQLILNTVLHGLSNARSEATNTHLRLVTRRAYGYRTPEPLIAIADLTRGPAHHSPDDHENQPTETAGEPANCPNVIPAG